MQSIEEMLKDYYDKQKRIEYLKRRYERLGDNIKEVERHISSTKHTLEISLPSQRYDIERVSTSHLKHSPQETALIRSEERMEQQIRDFQLDQEECLIERYELEGECERLNSHIQLLNDEEQMICEMKYKFKKSLILIGYDINADRSTIHRKLKKIKEKLAQDIHNTA